MHSTASTSATAVDTDTRRIDVNDFGNPILPPAFNARCTRTSGSRPSTVTSWTRSASNSPSRKPVFTSTNQMSAICSSQCRWMRSTSHTSRNIPSNGGAFGRPSRFFRSLPCRATGLNGMNRGTAAPSTMCSTAWAARTVFAEIGLPPGLLLVRFTRDLRSDRIHSLRTFSPSSSAVSSRRNLWPRYGSTRQRSICMYFSRVSAWMSSMPGTSGAAGLRSSYQILTHCARVMSPVRGASSTPRTMRSTSSRVIWYWYAFTSFWACSASFRTAVGSEPLNGADMRAPSRVPPSRQHTRTDVPRSSIVATGSDGSGNR
ncbi:hypothetical protein C1I95_25835 [Micromonospora craterilacus]|uniref:Uncharacterized protein n=1 Tax=Micromonospora craterilacus TaxID=1655439 RepID=A0A2W2DKK6_9ACTN|nr:hypothetical protein C1I95_25835 [Micromonospora craterilacus]